MSSNKSRHVVMLLGLDFLNPHLDPRVYKEARSMAANGYRVSVLCWFRGKEGPPRSELYEDIEVVRVFQPIPHFSTSIWRRALSYLLFILKLVRNALPLHADVLHCHDLDTLLGGVLLKFLTRKRLVFDAHEDFPGMLESVSRAQGRFARTYEKLLIRFADRVIAAEEPRVAIMKKHYHIEPTLIMNLPDLSIFHPDIDPSPVIAEYGL